MKLRLAEKTSDEGDHALLVSIREELKGIRKLLE
jgi:hypothetical protein